MNWSLATDEGHNLFDPGHTPADNLQFLYFLAATLKAIHRHGGLFRAAIAFAGNDHRLGANEAPPAIMSAFLGAQLSRILEAIERGDVADAPRRRSWTWAWPACPPWRRTPPTATAPARSPSPATSSSSGRWVQARPSPSP